jgi:hypothetical protein
MRHEEAEFDDDIVDRPLRAGSDKDGCRWASFRLAGDAILTRFRLR